MNTERRQFMRFLADDRAFACLRPYFEKLGKIKDISRGGLAFEYLCNDGLKEASSEIDIFLSGNGFYLPKMPCKVVYDFQIGEDLTSVIFTKGARDFVKITMPIKGVIKLEVFFYALFLSLASITLLSLLNMLCQEKNNSDPFSLRPRCLLGQ